MKQVMELPEEKREIVAECVFRQMCDTRTPTGNSYSSEETGVDCGRYFKRRCSFGGS